MDLVRTELFSSIFREMNISNYIDKNIIDIKSQIKKINSKYDINLIIKVHESLRLRNEEAESGFNNLKSKYIKLQKVKYIIKLRIIKNFLRKSPS